MTLLTAARRSRRTRGLTAVTALATGSLCLAPAATASSATAPGVPGAPARPPVVVSLGDSFISGEAGRWQGNSLESKPGHDGTDRAWRAGRASADPKTVYGPTYVSGCHRSDSAEVRSAEIAVDGVALPAARKINLACSGATSSAVLLPADGGKPFKGERSQAEQLAEVAKKNDVRLVVLSLGGNDLGFSDVISGCVAEFMKPVGGRPCSERSGRTVREALPRMRTAVAGAVDSVRKAMSGAGRAAGSYRLVLQSYPSPLPSGARVRYASGKYDRFARGGCPFFDKDLTWAHDELVPAISASLAKVAAEKGAEFLDLSAAFDGREVCATAASQVTPSAPASDRSSEWVRFLAVGTGQGLLQESLHPNHFGQRALGACLARVHAAPGRTQHRCVNSAGLGAEGMKLSSAVG